MTCYVNRNEITKNFQYEAPDFATKKDYCSSPTSLFTIDSTPASDPYKTPPIKKLNKTAAQWEAKRAEYFHSQGIDYYHSSHSGVSPPDQGDNDTEDEEDEEEPARKLPRR